MSNKVTVVVPAAGKGKRMQQHLFPDTPKALLPLHGKPMIAHLLEAVYRSAVTDRIVVVIAPEQISRFQTTLTGYPASYVLQPKPLGTGDAVRCALPHLDETSEHVMVLYGDQPLISASTIQKLANTHQAQNGPITMLTVKLPDFEGWRSPFLDYGRVIRNTQGHFERSVEASDATADELRVTEVNPSLYCFRLNWLSQHIAKVQPRNAQGEYYLTDVLTMSAGKGSIRTALLDDPREALGANTPDQFATLEHVYKDIDRG